MKTVSFDESEWQLVPVEATEEMLEAGFHAIEIGGGVTEQAWAELLADAPTPAEAQADVARLDWLVASNWYIGPEYGADEAGGIVGYDNKNIDGLRAAIDAAMSEKGQQA